MEIANREFNKNTRLLRILFVAPFPPTIIRTREFNFVKELSLMGHKVYWISPRDSRESIEIENAYKYCDRIFEYKVSKKESYKNMILSLFSFIPLQVAYCYHPKISGNIFEIINKFNIDIIHVVHLRSAQFIENRVKIPIIIDLQDCLTNLYKGLFGEISYLNFFKKMIYGIEYFKLFKYEAGLRFKNIVVISEKEKKFISNILSKKNKNLNNFNIHVINNGVDFNFFDPKKVKDIYCNEDFIIFVGKMSYISNELAVIYFVRKIFPFVLEKFPKLKFYIVGSSPSKKVLLLEKHPNVKVTGFVPDIRPYLKKAKLFIAPFKTGAGLQNKILEALSMKIPVVATSRVANPIGIENRKNALIADKDNDFADCINSILINSKLKEELGTCGRNFVIKKYSWNKMVRLLVNIYNSILL